MEITRTVHTEISAEELGLSLLSNTRDHASNFIAKALLVALKGSTDPFQQTQSLEFYLRTLRKICDNLRWELESRRRRDGEDGIQAVSWLHDNDLVYATTSMHRLLEVLGGKTLSEASSDVNQASLF